MGGAFGAALALDALHDLDALGPEPVHFGDRFHGVLQVTVQRDAAVAAGGLQPGVQGCFLAESAGEPDAAHLRVRLRRLADDVPAVVGGAIVDEEHLVADVGGGEDLGQPPGHFGDVLRFVVGGEDDGEKRFSGQGVRPPFG